ncbi:hypothetical protein SAMN06309944_0833 [Micrococcales bacterium KH10]|nr:hypothetical protein SAMN06309944_0833 [Micrococcales bacterium KH10]
MVRDLARVAVLIDGQNVAAKKGAVHAELERARRTAGDLAEQVRALTEKNAELQDELDRSSKDLNAIIEDAQWFAVMIAGKYKRARWKGYTGQVRERCERYVVTGR